MADKLVFQCFKENLLTALNTIYPAVTTKDPIMAYRCVHLKITDNALEVTGANREFTIATEVSGRITTDDHGTISVDASLLRGAIASMADNDTIYIKVVDAKMIVQGTRRQYKLNCLEYDTVPTPKLPNKLIGKLEQGRNGVFRGFYASDEEGNLSAIRFDARIGKLIVSATNQYRFASIEVESETVASDSTEIACIGLPKKTANVVLKLFKDEAIEIFAEGNLIGFKGTTATLVSTTMAFVPPDLTKLIPVEWSGSMKLPVKELKAMADTVLMLLPESHCAKLILNFAVPSITINTSEQQLGSGVTEVVGENSSNPSLPSKTVMINMKYFVDALVGTDATTVELLVSQNNLMLGIRPEFSTNEIHLIMAMVVR